MIRKLLALTSAIVITVGCSAGTTAPAAVTGPNFPEASTLTIRVDGQFATFVPGVSNLPSMQLNAAVYDRLMYIGSDGKTQPWLASSWELSPTTLKFNIKKGVTCSDGTPLTPSAIAKHFDQQLGISDPKTKSSSALGAFGPGPYRVAADDAAGTFTLTLGSPFVLASTSMGTATDGQIVSPKGLVPGALADTAQGSGPYTVSSVDKASQVVLKLRPDWTWGPRSTKGLPGTLVYKVVANDTTAANLLLTGGLDIARVLSATDVKRLLADKSLGQLARTPYYTNPVWMNMNPPHPTADPVVRQAIVTAISAEEYNQAAYGGFGEVTTSLFAKNAPCFEPGTAQYIPQTDTAKAKQLLIAAGWQDVGGKLVKNGQPLKLQLIGSAIQDAGPEYLNAQLTKVGFTLDYVNIDQVSYSANYLQPGKFDVIVPGIASDILGQYLLSYHGPVPPPEGTGRNFSRNTDASLSALINSARSPRKASTGSAATRSGPSTRRLRSSGR